MTAAAIEQDIAGLADLPRPDLIARWRALYRGNPPMELAAHHGVDRTDVGRRISLAFLAPDIVEAIVAGRQPIELTAARLKRVRDLPISWAEQRKLLDFPR